MRTAMATTKKLLSIDGKCDPGVKQLRKIHTNGFSRRKLNERAKEKLGHFFKLQRWNWKDELDEQNIISDSIKSVSKRKTWEAYPL